MLCLAWIIDHAQLCAAVCIFVIISKTLFRVFFNKRHNKRFMFLLHASLWHLCSEGCWHTLNGNSAWFPFGFVCFETNATDLYAAFFLHSIVRCITIHFYSGTWFFCGYIFVQLNSECVWSGRTIRWLNWKIKWECWSESCRFLNAWYYRLIVSLHVA